MATHRELVYDLTAVDAHQVGKIAREHGLETQTWMVTAADCYRLGPVSRCRCMTRRAS